jgi:AI-2 transport protein TqsA
MNTYFSRSLRFFVGFASIGLSVTFVKAYAYYFNAFFLALVIVMSVSPIMFWLRKHGVPNWLALGVGMIVTLSMTALLAIVIALSVVRVSDILPQLVAQIDGLTESLDQFFSRSGIQVAELIELVDLVEPDQLFFFGRRLLDTILQSVNWRAATLNS